MLRQTRRLMVTTVAAIMMVAASSSLKVAAVGSLADRGPKADGRVDLSFEVKIFGDDAGVPCPAGCRHEAGDEVGKNPGQDQFLPALDSLQPETKQHSFKSVGIAMAPAMTLNRMYHCVPKQQQRDGADAEATAHANQQQQNNRKQSRRGHGCGDLSQRLRDARELWIEADRDTGRNGP